jgi:hypothetical protein
MLLMFDVRFDELYVLNWLAVQNELLHWLCTSELILKQCVLLSVWFHDCFI